MTSIHRSSQISNHLLDCPFSPYLLNSATRIPAELPSPKDLVITKVLIRHHFNLDTSVLAVPCHLLALYASGHAFQEYSIHRIAWYWGEARNPQFPSLPSCPFEDGNGICFFPVTRNVFIRDFPQLLSLFKGDRVALQEHCLSWILTNFCLALPSLPFFSFPLPLLESAKTVKRRFSFILKKMERSHRICQPSC